MDNHTQEIINRFQDSLSTLRKVAGWSAENLGEILDVTRQTIVNLETGQTKMTKVQYLAFRATFQKEIQDSKNEMLAKLIFLLVDSDELDNENRTEVKKTVDSATSSIGRRAGASTASKAAISALAPVITGTTISALIPPLNIVGGIIATTASITSLFSMQKNENSK